jgi:hypothetical protein
MFPRSLAFRSTRPHLLAALFSATALLSAQPDFRHGLRAPYAELVKSGRLPEKTFHDRILERGPMPIEMARAHVTATKLPRDDRSSWKFLEVQP